MLGPVYQHKSEVQYTKNSRFILHHLIEIVGVNYVSKSDGTFGTNPRLQ